MGLQLKPSAAPAPTTGTVVIHQTRNLPPAALNSASSIRLLWIADVSSQPPARFDLSPRLRHRVASESRVQALFRLLSLAAGCSRAASVLTQQLSEFARA